MAKGDQADCLIRIKSTLPTWFAAGPTPILDALLNGPAWGLAWVYTLYAYAKLQLRVTTASDGWLDLIAQDLFGSAVRRLDDNDDTFRRRIQLGMFRERNTHHALLGAVKSITGNTPGITESSFAAVVTVDPGPASTSTITAAIDAVRPICCTVTLILGTVTTDFFATEDGTDLIGGDASDLLTT